MEFEATRSATETIDQEPPTTLTEGQTEESFPRRDSCSIIDVSKCHKLVNDKTVMKISIGTTK